MNSAAPPDGMLAVQGTMWYTGDVQLGTWFRPTCIDPGVGPIRSDGTAVEDLVIGRSVADDFVVGRGARGHQDSNGPGEVRSTFGEPLVLFRLVATISPLKLATGIDVLPQGQAAATAWDPNFSRRPVRSSPTAGHRLGYGWFPRCAPGAALDQAEAPVEDRASEVVHDPIQRGMEVPASWRPGCDPDLVEQTGGGGRRYRRPSQSPI